MKRRIIGKLLKLKESDDFAFAKQPTIIMGAKQVGKSYVVRELADICSFNFISLKANEVINTENLSKKDSLIFIDNMDIWNDSISIMVKLWEKGFMVFGAIDSLNLSFVESIPQARIETLHTMDFEEYLWSKGKTDLAELIIKHFKTMEPLEEKDHSEALSEFENYVLAGGMPTALCAHLYHKNPEKEHEYKELIADAYVVEMTKGHSNSATIKIEEVYNSIPKQLVKVNKKFQYKYIKEGARASFYEPIIQYMSEKGTIMRSGKLESKSNFKLYLNDTGLLSWKLNLNIDNYKQKNNRKKLEALYENYVAIQLFSRGYKLNYWESKGTAEVQFVIDKNGESIPIEISMETNPKAKNLKIYEDINKPKYSIKVTQENFSLEGNCRKIPFYALFNL